MCSTFVHGIILIQETLCCSPLFLQAACLSRYMLRSFITIGHSSLQEPSIIFITIGDKCTWYLHCFIIDILHIQQHSKQRTPEHYVKVCVGLLQELSCLHPTQQSVQPGSSPVSTLFFLHIALIFPSYWSSKGMCHILSSGIHNQASLCSLN